MKLFVIVATARQMLQWSLTRASRKSHQVDIVDLIFEHRTQPDRVSGRIDPCLDKHRMYNGASLFVFDATYATNLMLTTF